MSAEQYARLRTDPRVRGERTKTTKNVPQNQNQTEPESNQNQNRLESSSLSCFTFILLFFLLYPPLYKFCNILWRVGVFCVPRIPLVFDFMLSLYK